MCECVCFLGLYYAGRRVRICRPSCPLWPPHGTSHGRLLPPTLRVYSPRPPAHLRVATLNVNGLSSKIKDVGAMLLAGGADILLLQETFVRATNVRARFTWYSAFRSFGDRVPSVRGCCALGMSSLHARVIGTPHPCCTCVRVRGGGNNDSTAIIFITAYLPTGSQGEPYRSRLREVLAQLCENSPRDTVVVWGGVS
jgi:exonuclease III